MWNAILRLPTGKQQADAPEWWQQVPVLPLSSCVTLSRLIKHSSPPLSYLCNGYTNHSAFTRQLTSLTSRQSNSLYQLQSSDCLVKCFLSLSLSLLCPLLITLHGLQIFISLIPLMNHVWGLHRLRAHNNADILLNLKATIREEKIHTHMVHLAFRFSNPP